MPVQKIMLDTRLLIPTDDLLGAGMINLLELPSTAAIKAALDEMVARDTAMVVTEDETAFFGPTQRYFEEMIAAQPRFAAILLQGPSSGGDQRKMRAVNRMSNSPAALEPRPPTIQDHFAEAIVSSRTRAIRLLAASLDAVNGWLRPGRLPEFVFRLGIAAAGGDLSSATIEGVVSDLVDRREPDGPHLRQPPVRVESDEAAVLYFLRAVQCELAYNLESEAPLRQCALALLEAALLILDSTDLDDELLLAQRRRARTPEQHALVEQLRPFTQIARRFAGDGQSGAKGTCPADVSEEQPVLDLHLEKYLRQAQAELAKDSPA
jgi:hypothetical protein